ncbi:unnamed protein product [Brachionus calyciflorus]|uniref:Uncharacterized protein n=1 Tax=Brachionus calyciflorus TaxID=104777 RepID=A0A814HGV9_9BILA|nr:unnamed protein product [Brachionus calyciflorus]
MSFSSSSLFDKIDNTRVETPSHSFSNTFLLQNYKTSSHDSLSIKNEYLSELETTLLRCTEPVKLKEEHVIEVNGHKGIWANRDEVLNWKGEIPIENYPINQDPNPKIIHKKYPKNVEYIQELAIRYLKPPSVPPPGDIIINQLPNKLTPPAPPIIIRQQPMRPQTPEPIVIREAPPPLPDPVSRKIITISGKRLPPPPRKVIIERLPQIPSKPQSIIIERWLPYTEVKRRVIFNKNLEPEPVVAKPRNVIVQWEAPKVTIHKQFKFLGIVRANPAEYIERYGDSITQSDDLPDFVKKLPSPNGVTLAADLYENSNKKFIHDLYGDIDALKLVDLDREGLSEYKNYKIDVQDKIIRDYKNFNFSDKDEIKKRDYGKFVEVIEYVFDQVSKKMNFMIDFEDTMKVINLINESLNRKFSEDDIRRILESLDLNNFIKTGTVRLSDFKRAVLNYASTL